MRYGFITCVELGRSCIEEILDVGGHLEFMGTLHDDLAVGKSGRTYIDDLAARAGTPLAKFRHINDADARSAIAEAELDWLFVIGWSQIAGPEALALPRLGVLGMHPTLLPEGRGRAAIPWAILKGLERTGVTLFKLAEGVDTGDILAQHELRIGPRETATTLYARVEEAHRALMHDVWPALEEGRVRPVPQDETRASEWPGRRPEDGLLNPHAMTVEEVDRHVRALTRPYPGAFTDAGGERVTIWSGHPYGQGCEHDLPRLACRDGEYCIESAQPRECGVV